MKIRNKVILTLICKLGYWRNNLKLESLKVVNRGRFYIYNVNGMHIASEAFNWYLSRPVLEREVKHISCKYYTPSQGDTVIDIGAGLGEEACIYADMVGPAGTVYAIEANPVVYDVLRQVIELNGLSHVRSFNVAISSTSGKVKIDDAPLSYLSSSLDNEVKGVVYEVDGLTLESFCATNDIKNIHLLKVNIEGAERFLSNSFSNEKLLIHNVAISCHDFRFEKEGNEFFRTKQLVVDYLTANDYETWFQQTGVKHIDDWVYGKKRPASVAS
ncbi:FkbM family methyltransferase [Hymenobacter sp.]|uniref:FkbM family methyltransferase n=1 Tax=Hymenobacter sp. TaxID=1898978 RepID=UPI00286D2F75|nr:FkbM family methyltransferase [Hymenobacter sp.]